MAASRCRLQLSFLFVSALILQGAEGPVKLTFETDVSPILTQRCVACHGENGPPQADLNLTTFSGLLGGGKTGPAVRAGVGRAQSADRQSGFGGDASGGRQTTGERNRNTARLGRPRRRVKAQRRSARVDRKGRSSDFPNALRQVSRQAAP